MGKQERGESIGASSLQHFGHIGSGLVLRPQPEQPSSAGAARCRQPEPVPHQGPVSMGLQRGCAKDQKGSGVLSESCTCDCVGAKPGEMITST